MNLIVGGTGVVIAVPISHVGGAGGITGNAAWATDNALIATVAGSGTSLLTGTITAVAAGLCNITVTITPTSGPVIIKSIPVSVTASSTAAVSVALQHK